MAKLVYQQAKGHRIKRRGFYDVTSWGDNRHCWDSRTGRWVHHLGPWTSTHFTGVRSHRAFRRRLREWSRYLPKGVEFELVSRWVGHSITGRTT